MEEIWKDVKDYKGLYQVSNIGNVKSLRNNKILKFLYRRKEAYASVILCDDKKRKQFTVHRLVCVAFLLNPENKEQVNHKNGIKNDNRLENLEWVTRSENIIHAFNIGLKKIKKGQNHGMSKINEIQAKEIKYTHFDISLKEIGKIYGIKASQVCKIKKGQLWSHI